MADADATLAHQALDTLKVRIAQDNPRPWAQSSKANNYRKDSTTSEVGSQVQAIGSIVLKAGADINARAADVQAGTSLSAIAGNNLNVVAGVNAVTVDEGYQRTESGFMHDELITTRDTLDRSSALGSSLGGTSVNLIAGNDIKVTGSAIAGDAAVNLTAKNAITITAAIDTSKEDHARTVKESGFLSGGGFGISYGERTTSTDQQLDASLQSGQARSLVGSTGGSLTLNAGAAINVAGSDLMAGQDINLTGKSVTITPGQDQVDGKFVSKMTQDGFTLAVGGSVVNAIQAMQSDVEVSLPNAGRPHDRLCGACQVGQRDYQGGRRQLLGGAQSRAGGDAQDHDLRPRARNARPQYPHQTHRRPDLFRRPAHPLAARVK